MKKIFLLTLLILAFSCNRHPRLFSKTEFLMDTICEVKVVTSNRKFANRVMEKVFSEVANIDKKLGFDKESEIVKINTNGWSSPVKVSDDTYYLIEKSIEIYKLTDGAFDITTGVLTSLWGFDNFSKKEKFVVPSHDEIIRVLQFVDASLIVLDKNTKTVFLKKKGVRLNVGGIAKGYAIKRAKEILESYNIEKFLINFGGDVYVKNGKGKTLPWRVAVQHPRDKNKFLTVLELYTTSCATSGDYERYFMTDNKRYHHIFDPKTGYPKEGVVSVTVLCEDPVLADALSTAIFVLGKEKGLKLAQKLNIECIIVEEVNKKLKVYTTNGLKDLVYNL